ncbi:MAG: DUF3626 domain-containing protein [Myxococcales bacterium]|nr:DUF3626 domain-containing protein [Myxococcales bacterium]
MRPLAEGSLEAAALAFVAARSEGPPLAHPWPITVHFHPDRSFETGSILESMARDGRLRSQFETATSNGGLSAFEGGDRWRWEHEIFGAVYDRAAPSRRPCYGALNFRSRPEGAAPRFGSAHFRLTPAVLARCTFCYPDSYFQPTRFGVAAAMSLIALAEGAPRDALDDYIEAQIHGPVRLAEDVEALVLDPCYRGTWVEAEARRLPCPIAWHHGFALDPERLRALDAYRGPEVVALGLRLARGAPVTPATLGDAARSGRYDPQALKKLWHCVARFGARDAAPTT